MAGLGIGILIFVCKRLFNQRFFVYTKYSKASIAY